MLVAIAIVATLTGCSHGSSTTTPGPTPPPALPVAPDLHDFLQLPAASPTACPSGATAETVGRVSPWTGHVDISVFLTTAATPAVVASIGKQLRAQPTVGRVYFESSRQAHEEFARLYTCSASVPVSQTPASYRVVLKPGTTTLERNGIVAMIVREAGIDSVSCDPSNPCVDVVNSAKPSG